jgi:cyclic pyranopterin phosphate synthase
MSEKNYRDELPKNFCPIPFSNLIFNPDGNVAVCRRHSKSLSVGNIIHQNLEEIWNGEKIQNWREEFLTGNIQICADKIKNSRCHLSNEQLLPFVTLEKVQKMSLMRVTANFNGECNLECPMCTIWKMPNGKYNKLLEDQNFKKVLSTIKEIDFYAGEPFIQQDTFRMIDILSEINPNLIWMFTTNGQWELDADMKKSLSKILLKTVHFSIDSFDPTTYSLIRKKGAIAPAIETIKRLVEFRETEYPHGHIVILISTTIQRLNCKQVASFIRESKSLGCIPFVQYLHEPKGLSLNNLPEVEKLNLINQYFSEMSDEEITIAQELLKTLIMQLNNLDKKFYMLKFLSAVQRHYESLTPSSL